MGKALVLSAGMLVVRHRWTLGVAIEYVCSVVQFAKSIFSEESALEARVELEERLGTAKFQYRRIRLDTLKAGKHCSEEDSELTLIHTSLNASVRDLTKKEGVESHRVDVTWQGQFKGVKWVDEVTKEHLCDEAVVFDEKLYTMTPQRKV